MAPQVGEKCALTGGQWYSYYDNVYVDAAGKLDVDHMVPLAEAWDSGARGWDAQRREAYANDLGAEVPLVAVTAASNRSKADKDPAQWMPPAEAATCQYIHSWISVKTRWGLAVDQAESDKLAAVIADCPEAVVDIEQP